MFGANLVIPAQICDKESCGQVKVYGQKDGEMDRRTNTGSNNTPLAWEAKGWKIMEQLAASKFCYAN